MEINKIVIHCADTPDGADFDISDIKRWHTDPPPKGNGWSDVGYHYVIKLNGLIQKGRMDNVPGAHVKNFNMNSLGICYIGGKDGDTRTFKQRLSLTFLLNSLMRMYPKAEIVGHCDLDPKKPYCPGFDAKKEYGYISKNVEGLI